jgi:hypothetical protein
MAQLSFFAAFLAATIIAPAAYAEKTEGASRGLQVIFAHPEIEELSRSLASSRDGTPSIYYLTESSRGRANLDVISPQRWQRMSEGERYDRLVKFYFANTRDRSNRGLRHTACFMGDGGRFLKEFFDPQVRIKFLENDVVGTVSNDTYMVGIQFQAKLPDQAAVDAHFRVLHCQSSGKMGLISEAEEKGANRNPQSVSALPKVKGRLIASVEQEGFQINDEVKGGRGLPRFELKADYEKARPSPEDRPWQGMDIRTEEGARLFADTTAAYFYDGLANQNVNPERNFIAQDSSRYWCHMPWLNQGDSQREGIHGLTKERDLRPSPMYQVAGKGDNDILGSDWGVAFYNSYGCQTLGKIFGSPKSGLVNPPNWSAARFEDGTLAAKILFTTADFPALRGAFEWMANVSQPRQTDREITPVKYIQIDLAVRDSSIKGTKPDSLYWVMTSYYYDREYEAPADSPIRRIKNLPPAFLKMRPIGVQTGFEVADSLIFKGSMTNQPTGRLNGPADNPASSCLSCHGVAGTRIAMSPGIMSNVDFKTQVANRQHLDYSQQVALARRNYETRARNRIELSDRGGRSRNR